MLKQIIDENEIVGKTIAGIKEPYHSNELFIFFTDETFCCYTPENGYDGAEASFSFIEYEFKLDNLSDVLLLESVNIITEAEAEPAKQASKRKDAERMRTNDLIQLKKLMEKYPDVKPE